MHAWCLTPVCELNGGPVSNSSQSKCILALYLFDTVKTTAVSVSCVLKHFKYSVNISFVYNNSVSVILLKVCL